MRLMTWRALFISPYLRGVRLVHGRRRGRRIRHEEVFVLLVVGVQVQLPLAVALGLAGGSQVDIESKN